MEPQWIAVMIAGGIFLLSICGIAFKMGMHASKISRNELDIKDLNTEFKKEIAESLRRIYERIDQLPCHSPRAGKSETCIK